MLGIKFLLFMIWIMLVMIVILLGPCIKDISRTATLIVLIRHEISDTKEDVRKIKDKVNDIERRT